MTAEQSCLHLTYCWHTYLLRGFFVLYPTSFFFFFFFCSQVFNSACESEVFCCRCFVRDVSVVQLRCKSTPAVLNQSRLSCLCVVISALPPAARSSATVTHMNSTDLKVSSLVIYCPNKPKNKQIKDCRSRLRVIKVHVIRNILVTKTPKDLRACLETERRQEELFFCP